MREITPAEANETYSVKTAFHEMQPGGEVRFRLLHGDGTRYIRTEYPDSAKGTWQEAHYHRSVLETYIVQKGWIAFADDREGALRLRILTSGDIVTVQPGVRHNVYLPSGCIFHTIKHGAGQGEDKEPAPEFNVKCESLSTEEAIVAAASPANIDGTRKIYTEEYRHFDSLIWQMPGWSTAILLGTAAVLGQASYDNLAKLLPSFSVPSLIAGFLLVVFSFLLGLTQALYRFRRHQAPLKQYTWTNWWSSASTHLQIYVTAQAFLVLYVALGVMYLPLNWALVSSVSCFLVLAVYREWRLRAGHAASHVGSNPAVQGTLRDEAAQRP